MTNEKLSEVLFDNLWAESLGYKRPEVRQETLTNMKAACDAIEDGRAKKTIEAHTGKHKSGELKITALNIERYAKAEGWKGPVRSSCDPAYVQAREDERDKKDEVKPPRNKNRDLEQVISLIDDMAARQYVRTLAAQKTQFENKHSRLLAGLKEIPAIDVDALEGEETSSQMTVLEAPARAVKGLSLDDIAVLQAVYRKLTNNEQMKHMGLEFDGDHLASKLNGERLLEQHELEVMRRLSAPVGGK